MARKAVWFRWLLAIGDAGISIYVQSCCAADLDRLDLAGAYSRTESRDRISSARKSLAAHRKGSVKPLIHGLPLEQATRRMNDGIIAHLGKICWSWQIIRLTPVSRRAAPISFHDLIAHFLAHLACFEEPPFDFRLDHKRGTTQRVHLLFRDHGE